MLWTALLFAGLGSLPAVAAPLLDPARCGTLVDGELRLGESGAPMACWSPTRVTLSRRAGRPQRVGVSARAVVLVGKAGSRALYVEANGGTWSRIRAPRGFSWPTRLGFVKRDADAASATPPLPPARPPIAAPAKPPTPAPRTPPPVPAPSPSPIVERMRPPSVWTTPAAPAPRPLPASAVGPLSASVIRPHFEVVTLEGGACHPGFGPASRARIALRIYRESSDPKSPATGVDTADLEAWLAGLETDPSLRSIDFTRCLHELQIKLYDLLQKSPAMGAAVVALTASSAAGRPARNPIQAFFAAGFQRIDSLVRWYQRRASARAVLPPLPLHDASDPRYPEGFACAEWNGGLFSEFTRRSFVADRLPTILRQPPPQYRDCLAYLRQNLVASVGVYVPETPACEALPGECARLREAVGELLELYGRADPAPHWDEGERELRAGRPHEGFARLARWFSRETTRKKLTAPCARLSDGQSTLVDGHVLPNGMVRHRLARRGRDFTATLNLDFQAAAGSPSQSGTLLPIAPEDLAAFPARIRACYRAVSPNLRDPAGRRIEIRLCEGAECDGVPPRRINVRAEPSGKKTRDSSGNWSLDIPCPVVLHETLHLLGLPDEYQESVGGVDVRADGLLDAVNPWGVATSGERAPPASRVNLLQSDCRAIGPKNSIMHNHVAATELPMTNFRRRVVCGCGDALARQTPQFVTLPSALRTYPASLRANVAPTRLDPARRFAGAALGACQSALAAAKRTSPGGVGDVEPDRSVSACPAGSKQLSADVIPSRFLLATEPYGAIYVEYLVRQQDGIQADPDLFQFDLDPPAPLSVSYLDPAHFRVLSAPGCVDDYMLYAECARAEGTSRAHFGAGCAIGIPAECRDPSRWTK